MIIGHSVCLLPCFRTELSMSSGKERGREYVEEQARGFVLVVHPIASIDLARQPT